MGSLFTVFCFRFWDGWGKEMGGGTSYRLPRLTRGVVRNKATAQTELGPPMGVKGGDREPWAGRPRQRADRHGDSPTRSPFGEGRMRGDGLWFWVYCFLFSVRGWETAQTELGPPMGGGNRGAPRGLGRDIQGGGQVYTAILRPVLLLDKGETRFG